MQLRYTVKLKLTKGSIQFCLEPFCMLSWDMHLCCQLFACLKTSHDAIYITFFPSAVSMLKRPTITDYQSAESEQLMKRLRPSGHGVDEVILHLHSENMTFFIFYEF